MRWHDRRRKQRGRLSGAPPVGALQKASHGLLSGFRASLGADDEGRASVAENTHASGVTRRCLKYDPLRQQMEYPSTTSSTSARSSTKKSGRNLSSRWRSGTASPA